MSKIIVTGSAIVLKSSLTLKDFEKLVKYNPDALETRDEKGKLIFKVGIAGNGTGLIADSALYFAPQTHDTDGLATITTGIPESVSNAQEYAAELFGRAYPKLVAIEATMADAVQAMDDAKAAMLENITVQ